jgi:flagellar M-ring protein FliF
MTDYFAPYLKTLRQPQYLVAFAAAGTVGAVLLAVTIFNPAYTKVYSGLKPAAAASIAVELQKRKIPFKVSDDGSDILVEKSKAGEARIDIAGGESTSHGQVGLEVFSKTDLGLTEFAERINYQRALQGELTRTIISLDGIDSARIHLSLSNPGVAGDARSAARASVALTLKPGRTIGPAAVRGIQHLVASSVPDLAASDVFVLNQIGEVISSEPIAPSQADGQARAPDDGLRYWFDRVQSGLTIRYPSLDFSVEISKPTATPDDAKSVLEKVGRTDPLDVRIILKTPQFASVREEIRSTTQDLIRFSPTAGDSVTVIQPAKVASINPPSSDAAQSHRLAPGDMATWAGIGFIALCLVAAIAATVLISSRFRPRLAKLSEEERKRILAEVEAALSGHGGSP